METIPTENGFYDDSEKKERKEKLRERHYYGDTVRVLFLLGAIIMAVALPLFANQLPFPKEISLIAIVLIVVIAGLTDPVRKGIAVLNVVISMAGLLIFEYAALQSQTPPTSRWLDE